MPPLLSSTSEGQGVGEESIGRFEHVSTRDLESLLRETERRYGSVLPVVIAEIRAELGRRRSRSADAGSHA